MATTADPLPCFRCDGDVPHGSDACAECGQSIVVLDRYRIEERLGRGGMATVYGAVRIDDGTKVAVKVMRIRGQADWKGRELFERSSKVLRQLEHEQLPAVYDFGELDDGSLVLARERVDGGTLASAILDDHWRASAQQVERLLASLLDVLAFLHDRSPPVVHRDIKPTNVMFRKEGRWGERSNRPVLVDFDTVAAPKEGGDTIVVSPGYTAPEQLAGSSSPASDLYSLGMTMVFVATHRDPESFSRDDDGRIELGSALDSLDPQCRRIIEMLVEPNHRDRPRSAAWAKKELRKSTPAPSKPSGIVASRHRTGPTGATSNSKTRAVYVALGVATVIATSWALVAALGEPPTPPKPEHPAPVADAPAVATPPPGLPTPLLCDDPQLQDCDGDPANGCEQDLRRSADHCGACDNECDAKQRCVEGTCDYAVVAVVDHWLGRCDLRTDGSVWCASSSRNEDFTRVELPSPAIALDHDRHNCAVTADAALYCWGDNGLGQVGTGSKRRKEPKPVLVEGLHNVTHVSLGRTTVCAVADGQAYCWGSALSFKVIGGAKTSSDTPIKVPGMDNVTDLDSGAMHVCVAREDSVWCWGDGRGGATGDPARPHGSDPTKVEGIGAVDALALGADHSCALLPTGRVACWGTNSDGQLGNGTLDDSTTPVELALDDVVEIRASKDTSCARTKTTVHCWGRGVGDNHQPIEIEVPGTPIGIGLDSSRLSVILEDGRVEEQRVND